MGNKLYHKRQQHQKRKHPLAPNTMPVLSTLKHIARRFTFSHRISSTFRQRRYLSTPLTDRTYGDEYYPDPVIGRNRATISLTTKDYPGALANVLNALTENDINMTRIESRYGQKATQVNFFVDVDVSADHRRVAQGLTALKKHALDARLVPGSKPIGFPSHQKKSTQSHVWCWMEALIYKPIIQDLVIQSTRHVEPRSLTKPRILSLVMRLRLSIIHRKKLSVGTRFGGS
eukprot:688175_1